MDLWLWGFSFPFSGGFAPGLPWGGGGGGDVIAADTPVVNLVPCEPP